MKKIASLIVHYIQSIMENWVAQSSRDASYWIWCWMSMQNKTYIQCSEHLLSWLFRICIQTNKRNGYVEFAFELCAEM